MNRENRPGLGRILSLCLLAAGCGRDDESNHSEPFAGPGSTTSRPAPEDDDVLASVPCESWHPSDTSWSSLPLSRPAIATSSSASPSGTYLYSVGAWLDGGNVERQILRSGDRGETWCKLATPEPIAEVAPSRASESVLYALTCGTSENPARILETSDGGASWNATTALPGELAGNCGPQRPGEESRFLHTSVSTPDAVWVDASPSVARGIRHALYLSRDGGDSWAAPYPPEFIDLESGPVQGVVFDILVDPRSTDRMLAWGMSGDSSESDSWSLRYLITGDGGNAWREIPAPPLSGDVRWLSNSSALVVDADSTLYASDGAMVVRSTNWGESWIAADALPQANLDAGKTWKELPIVPFGRIAGSPIDRRIWMDGLDVQSSDGGLTWTHMGEAPSALLVDGVNADIAYSNVFYGSFGSRRTDDGGKTWAPSPIPPFFESYAAVTCRAPFSCLYALQHSSVDQRCVLVRSNDHARTWLQTTVPYELCQGWSSLAVSPEDPEHLIASCLHGVCETRDGGASWTSHAIGSDSDGVVESVAFMSDGVALAASDFVVRSEDGGSSWARVSQESGRLVSAADLRTVFLVNPTTGVSRSDDVGATWEVVWPHQETLGDSSFEVSSIVDAPEGGFIAATSYGLVKFE